MRNRAGRGLVWAVALLLAPLSVMAQEYRPGDQVVVIRDGKLTVSGGKEVDKVWPGLVLRVQDVNGKWLWLNNGKPGWLDRQNVIPLDRRAIDRLTEMIRQNPRSANLYSGRAHIWTDLGELDLALGDYSEAIRLDPAAAWYNNRGLIWSAKEEYDKAIADYTESIRLNPKVAMTFNNRGAAWREKGEYDKAIADYIDAIRLDPKYVTPYYNRGNAWQSKGEYDIAIRDYDEALRLDPKYSDAHAARGYTWRLKGDYDKALQDLTKALEINPKYSWAYKTRGLTLTAQQKYDEAIADYTEIIRLDPTDQNAYERRGEARKLKGDYDKAIQDHNRLIELAPNEWWTYRTRARTWAGWQKYDEALGDYAEAGRLDPTDVYPLIQGCLFARIAGKPERAEQFLKQGTERLSTDWPYPVFQYLKGELDEAALMRLATDRDREMAVRCYLALDFLGQGRPEEARPHLQWVSDHGNPGYGEFGIARVELQRLPPPAQ